MEIEYRELQYEKPEVIIQHIEEIEDQIKANIVELKKLLAEKYSSKQLVLQICYQVNWI